MNKEDLSSGHGLRAISFGNRKKMWNIQSVCHVRIRCDGVEAILLRMNLIGQEARFSKLRTGRIFWLRMSDISYQEIIGQGKVRLRMEDGSVVVLHFPKLEQVISLAI